MQRLGSCNGYGHLAEDDTVIASGAVAVSQDATSGKYVPANTAEWSAFISTNGLSISVPNHLYLCQETSGNLADSIGSLILTANASPLYGQTVSGWSRKGVGFSGGVNQSFRAGAGSGPNIATQSVCWLWFIRLETPPGNQLFTALSDASSGGLWTAVTFTPRVRFTYSGVASTDGTSSPSGQVRPFATMHDITGARARLFTDQEKISPAFQASRTDGSKGVGGFAGFAAATGARVLYGCAWSGAAAEISDANMKALLQALGWTIPWS